MPRSEIADLTAFIEVAEHLSFRAAALKLGVTPSALSHTMRQLEERLGVRLLNRTTRSVSITQAGQRLLNEVRPAIDRISAAIEHLNEERTRPVGHLRIHTNDLGALAVIAPAWSRFVTAYPDVQVEIGIDEGRIDIVASGFDAGIGIRDGVPADMIAVHVSGPIQAAVVGSPAYFALRPQPRTPDDLERHNCIQFRRNQVGELLKWLFEHDGKRRRISVKGSVTVNRMNMSVRAALDGLGIAYMAEAYAEPFLRSGQLIRVLENWSPSFEGLLLYYPSHHQMPAALRALINMLRTEGPARRAPDNPFASVAT
jgi:DNA-binding transcriptional LysR family regulator